MSDSSPPIKIKNLTEKLQMIISNIRDIIIESDLNGNFIYVSPQAYDVLGYKPEEVIGLNGYKFIHPEDLSKLKSKLKDLKKEGGPISAEYRVLHKDGHYVHLSAKGNIVKDNGNIKLIAILRDISLQKETEEKYQFITDNINDTISVFNDKFELLLINEAQEKISGFSKEEIIGKSPLEFLHPDDIKRARSILRKALKEGQGRGQFRMRSKDNSYKWMDVNGRITFDSDGNQRILLVSRDITKEKEIENKLKESEQKYRNLFENSPYAIGLMDMTGKILDCNSSQERIFGYKKHELISKDFREIQSIPQKFMPLVLKSFKKLIKGENVGPHEIQLYKKDGSLIWTVMQASLIELQNKTIIQAISQDITFLKEVELKLEEQNKELEQINELKTEFLRRASHELKTPLIAIKGNADLAIKLHYENLTPEVIKMLEVIQRGCERIEDIIHKLIESSKLETSKMELFSTKADLLILIKSCVNELQTLIKIRDIKIDIDIKKPIITKFNKDQIHEVMLNLLTNAITYSYPGGIININTKVSDKIIIVSIKDRGIGFTNDEKLKIFQKFGKINRINQGLDILSEGSGLGLYISKKIIELHGGNIWVESEGRNKGSTFYFTLPLT